MDSMELHFRFTEDGDRIRIMTRRGGLTEHWSHMQTVSTVTDAVEACGEELDYQLRQEGWR